jgi:hypothetical protein
MHIHRHPAPVSTATGFPVVLALLASILLSSAAAAQLATGSITGTVTDPTGAALPGVTVSLAGERLIGGAQTQVTDAAGVYRFDRLPPGTYRLRFELAGFRPVERSDIRITAAFTATVNAQLELGALAETITVAGESPTVDTKSNVQQVAMTQELLEGIPTGRDPWSLAKIIPGVHISTYDVGGTQSYQQSGMSVHGSLDADKTFAIDGLAVNWPGGNGGATMMYYDQGMFEEVSYQTSAIPAEVAVGGIFLNMVTKSPGNQWRGDLRASYANDTLQADNSGAAALREARERFGFQGGNPITRAYDVNASGGGALLRDRIWINGSYRKWAVDKLNLSVRNPDGSSFLDDNTLVNYFGKLQWQITPAHRLSAQYNWTDKDRGHRVDPPPNFVENRAALHQTNPSSSTQIKYSWVRGRLVLESNASAMIGTTNYFYQDEVRPTDIRVEDIIRSTASVAAPRHEELPNSRLQIDNAVSYAASGPGGTHQLKAGVQYARLRMHDQFWVNGDMHILFADGVPNAVRIFNTPTSHLSLIGWWGVFLQDSWSVGPRLTLNLGARLDRARGWYPDQSNPAGTFVGERRLGRTVVTDQAIAVWRTGLAYDLTGEGRTALKASYSRYAQQVGLNRVQDVHPFSFTSGTVPWTDLNGDRVPQMNELDFTRFSGFPGLNRRYADADGPDWPYSDEITAGVEHELLRDVRVAVMYYHRANRRLVGTRNAAVPPSAYTRQTVGVPGPPAGPGGTATFYNLDRAFLGRQDNVLDNDPLLDTDYDGVEITLTKRFSRRWQLLAGLTIGRHEGGVAGGDLNDPNNSQVFPVGIVGFDSTWALRLAGSYQLPAGFSVSGSLVANQGYPYQSTYTITRGVFPGLTRTSQSISLTRRGDERLPDVTMVDLRVARTFHLPGGRRFTPQLDLFNLGNAATVVRLTSTVGSRYLAPAEILSPRVARVGFSLDF